MGEVRKRRKRDCSCPSVHFPHPSLFFLPRCLALHGSISLSRGLIELSLPSTPTDGIAERMGSEGNDAGR